MIYLTLVCEFLKIGLFSVGGGLVTLPFLYKLADNYDWFTRETLVDMIAISESTPGPIGINMATYAGYSAAGFAGGVLASVALIVPSVIILAAVTRILGKFRENKYVAAAFYGIRPAVTALIASAAFGIIKMTLLDVPAYEKTRAVSSLLSYREIILFAVVFYLMKRFDKHPVCYIAACAAAGAAFGL
jgi:chromate transporter